MHNPNGADAPAVRAMNDISARGSFGTFGPFAGILHDKPVLKEEMMNIQSGKKRLGALSLGAVLVILFMEVGLLAATIKTRDGKIIKGQLRGMIVQKGETKFEKSAGGMIHNERQASEPTPSPTQLSAVEAEKKSPWLVYVTLVERIQPGTKDEPHVNAGETLLKLGIKFEYSGPDGDVPAPVAKITNGAGKEHIMLGNLQGTGGFACFEWIISASRAVFKEKPKSLASTTIAKCKDAVFYYYFLLPENAKEPLALVFGDAKPQPLVVK